MLTNQQTNQRACRLSPYKQKPERAQGSHILETVIQPNTVPFQGQHVTAFTVRCTVSNHRLKEPHQATIY